MMESSRFVLGATDAAIEFHIARHGRRGGDGLTNRKVESNSTSCLMSAEARRKNWCAGSLPSSVPLNTIDVPWIHGEALA